MILLCIISIVASIVDVTLTLRLVNTGRGREVNPIMRWTLREGAVATYVVALAQTIGAAVIGCVLIWQGYAAYGWILLGLLVAVRVESMAWNWGVLDRSRR
jgi:hypothetical protein